MFTKQDIVLLKGMFKSYTEDVVLLIRDEMDARFAASENKMMTRMDQIALHLEKKIDHVAADTAELIGNSILPQIAELQEEDIRIKKFVGVV